MLDAGAELRPARSGRRRLGRRLRWRRLGRWRFRRRQSWRRRLRRGRRSRRRAQRRQRAILTADIVTECRHSAPGCTQDTVKTRRSGSSHGPLLPVSRRAPGPDPRQRRRAHAEDRPDTKHSFAGGTSDRRCRTRPDGRSACASRVIRFARCLARSGLRDPDSQMHRIWRAWRRTGARSRTTHHCWDLMPFRQIPRVPKNRSAKPAVRARRPTAIGPAMLVPVVASPILPAPPYFWLPAVTPPSPQPAWGGRSWCWRSCRWDTGGRGVDAARLGHVHDGSVVAVDVRNERVALRSGRGRHECGRTAQTGRDRHRLPKG